jgi:S-adenosylmethionine synthetase
VSVKVDTFGTGTIDDQRLAAAVDQVFDLRPKAIISALGLLKPIYQQTAAHGHFGRELPAFTWERTDKVGALRRAAGLKQR